VAKQYFRVVRDVWLVQSIVEAEEVELAEWAEVDGCRCEISARWGNVTCVRCDSASSEPVEQAGWASDVGKLPLQANAESFDSVKNLDAHLDGCRCRDSVGKNVSEAFRDKSMKLKHFDYVVQVNVTVIPGQQMVVEWPSGYFVLPLDDRLGPESGRSISFRWWRLWAGG
jgi:hypothetical protein